MTEHTDFARAFTPGSRFVDPTDGETWEVDVVPVGQLTFRTGRVKISDPGYLTDPVEPEGLDEAIPPGSWPCEVAVSRGTVAAMRVRFGDGPADAWEPARLLDNGELYGFGVDGGLIAVFDADALEHSTGEQLEEAIDADPLQIARVIALRPGAEFFVSHSGKGDGGYPAWWGSTSDGRRVELIVEFDVLVYGTTTTFDLPLSSLPTDGPVFDPQLAMEGLPLEVVTSDDVRAPWTRGVPDHVLARMPEEQRQKYTDPQPVVLAMRASGRRSDGMTLSLRDEDDEPVWYESGGAVIVSGDDHTFYWTAHPAFDRAVTLRVDLRNGPFPMPAAPDNGTS